MNNQFMVSAAPLPFSNKNMQFPLAPGASITEIVQQVYPKPIEGIGAVVMIDGEPVPKEYWDRVRPKANTLVNVRIVPTGGGGGGKKNPIASLLSIAVLVAAPYISGAILGAAYGTSIGIGSLTYGSLLNAAIGAVARLAISALAPPPKSSNVGVTGSRATNPSESPTQFIEGARNSLDPFGVVPVNLGTNRMFPKQAARPFTETQDGEQYVRQLFTYGYGEQITIDELKIGDSLLTQYSDYEVSHKLEGDLDEGTSLFSNDVYQEDLSSQLVYETEVIRTTRPDIDEAITDITFPNGLVRYSGEGARLNKNVQFEMYYRATGSGDPWALYANPIYSGKTKEALRQSVRWVFPANGQYDLRFVRKTVENIDDQEFTSSYLTAVKSIIHQNPVNMPGINGTAIRIKATDQLNGSLEQFNAIVSTHIPDYDSDSGTWITQPSSNPASIYRYILQGAINARAIADSKIIISDLEAWHTYCVERGYTYNRVIDYETSVDELLRDVAAAGAASPAIVDGKRTVVVDRSKDTIVQIITPRNSWDYSGEMIYEEIPHALRVQFRNADKGYVQDERIVYADGYDENNATNYEVLEYQSCDNSDLAFKHGRRHIAGIEQRPETHSWMMDIENLVATRGDRVKLYHDVPIVGIGDGRIKTVTTDGGSPELVTGFTIDDTVTVATAATHYVRVRLSDGTFLYKELVTSIGSTSEFTFAVPFTIDDAPEVGDLCGFVEAGGELDLIITRIEPQDDLTARITAIDYAQPAIEDAESAAIPGFDSKISTPLEFIRPSAPILLNSQSDESAMIRNSDGSVISRAIFTLENTNDGDILTYVKVRPAGTSAFQPANVLEATPQRVILTGLDDGQRYDIHIRYKRANSTTYSKALEINNYEFEGAAATPNDVENFLVTVTGENALFRWDASTNLDIAYYQIKYSAVYEGATWGTAQILAQKVYETRFATKFQGGTYLIKAVDILGNESANAVAIITYNPGALPNVVATLAEHSNSPAWNGVKDNVEVTAENTVTLADTDSVGYYYFEESVNQGGLYPADVSAAILSTGRFVNDIFDMTDIFAESDIFGEGAPDVFSMADMIAVDDIFGIGTDAYTVELEYRLIETDPNDSPATYSDWESFTVGRYTFWDMQFRLVLTSLEENISPEITQATVIADVQDRIVGDDDLTVPVDGYTINFSPEFQETPAVVITIQNGETDDKIEKISSTAAAYEFKVYNATVGDYVERTFDFVAKGYGRKSGT